MGLSAPIRMSASGVNDRLVLVSDVLDTLVADPFSRGMSSHFGFSDMPSFLSAKSAGVWESFELGHLTEPELAASFFRDARPVDVPSLKRFLRDSYTLLPGAGGLLADLRAGGVAVHLCSNYGPWDGLIEEAVGLEAKHGAIWTFVSAEHGTRKPDREAFMITAERAQVRVEQCVLLDDRRRNCDGAVDAGYRGAVRFENVEEARRKLASYFGDWLLTKE